MTALTPSLQGPAAVPPEASHPSPPDYWSQLAWLTAGASPLAAWRRAARLSLADLAAAAGLEEATIAAIEARGHVPSLAEREALARALGLCAGDLED